RAPRRATVLARLAGVVLVAEVAERAEEVEHEVEALVGQRQLAVVGDHPLRPALAEPAAAALLDQRRGAVGARDAVARAGERDRVAAEAARGVEHVALLGRLGEPCGGEGPGLRVRTGRPR